MKKGFLERSGILISLIALVVAFVSLYFQFFYEKESLFVSVVNMDFQNSEIQCEPVIINKGTETVVMNRVSLKFGNNPSIDVQSVAKGPFILKPGEAVSFLMKDSLMPNEYYRDIATTDEFGNLKFDFSVVFNFVGENGSSKLYPYRVCILNLDTLRHLGARSHFSSYVDLFN